MLVQEPNSENSLDLIFVSSHCKKVIFVSDENRITCAIKNLMLDMPSPSTFQNIGL